jgi:phage protein D/phage baseplate assembly protein gpV
MLKAFPHPLIEINGQFLAPGHLALLKSVRVQQRLSLPTLCELTFNEEVVAFELGANLSLKMLGQSEALFTGVVTAIEYFYEPNQGRTFRVRGYDLLYQLRKRLTVQVYEQTSLKSLVSKLVADLGLTVELQTADLSWPQLVQYGQSDFDLLTKVTNQCGLYFMLQGQTLQLFSLTGNGVSLDLTLGETLLEARVELNSDQACQSVKASGWNLLEGKAFTAQASQPRSGRQIKATVTPVGSGERGILDRAAFNSEHLGMLVQAEMDYRYARAVTFWGVADGNTALCPGTSIKAQGLGSAVSGSYVLTSVNHLIDEKLGYVSELATQPPPSTEQSDSTIITLGIVTRVDNPNKLGRVKVNLPTFQQIESGWLSVLSAGVGPGKGSIILPDVNDLVLVMFLQGDLSQGLVLGGLYGEKNLPGSEEAGEASRRYIVVTGSGQKLVLDDNNKTIRLQNNDNSYMELSPEQVRVHANTKLILEAPGKGIHIRGATIDLEKA